jgi:hypothetical protein
MAITGYMYARMYAHDKEVNINILANMYEMVGILVKYSL